MNDAPDPRLYVLTDRAPDPRGDYVLYWCRAYRRAHDNRALDHAIARADALGLPVVVYEALDPRYAYASDRIHTFVLQGACETGAAFRERGCAYAFHLPRTKHAAQASRALAKLAGRAALVVTDWYPGVSGPRSLWSRTGQTARALGTRFEAYDDAAVVPMSLLRKPEIAARTIRPKVHALLDEALRTTPGRAPRVSPPREFDWPFEPVAPTRADVASLVASCEIDHGVAPVAHTPGGALEASARLERFVASGLARYDTDRNDMAQSIGSALSAHLHFGQLSPRAVALAARARSSAPDTARESFVEELIVRRALAFNHAMTEPAVGTYAAAPAWARATLAKHAADARPWAAPYEAWDRAATRDPLWNAAQRELLRDGTIHPYARMLWGKVGMTLAARPEDAFAWLVELNDRYALDGRDPNTYTNIAWCFGLHDHPYPERAVFGMVRSMTSPAAMRKFDVHPYLARVGASADLGALAPAKKAARAKPER